MINETITITGDTGPFEQRMRQVDAELAKRNTQLDATRCKQQDIAREWFDIERRANVGGRFVGFGKNIGKAVIGSLILAQIETQDTGEAGFLKRLGTSAAFGFATGGPQGAALAALAVTLSELINEANKVGERQKKFDEAVDRLRQNVVENARRTEEALNKISEITRSEVDEIERGVGNDLEEAFYQASRYEASQQEN